MSEDLKNAFKSNEREIKAYVEMYYTDDSIKQDATFSANFDLFTGSNVSELFDNDRIGNNYASLEQDYFTLNGTQAILQDNITTGLGVMSNDIFSNIQDPTFTITTTSTNMTQGITIYFQNNIVKSATLVLNGNETYTATSDKRFIQFDFNGDKQIQSAVITINQVERVDWRIRIQEIDFGLTSLYNTRDILSFTIAEQVSKLVENTPANELKLIIGNYDKAFDPINPQGLVKYLSSKTKIRVYIGAVVNETEQYAFIGEYYLYNWNNNPDGTTTFIGRNIIEKFNNQPLLNNYATQYPYMDIAMGEQELNNYLTNYDFDININLNNYYNFSTYYTNYELLKQFMSDFTLRESAIIYGDRNNVIQINNIDSTIKETLTKRQLIHDADFKIQDKINTVRISYDAPSRTQSQSYSQIVSATANVTLSKPSEIFLIRKPTAFNDISPVASQTGGSDAVVVDSGFFMSFVNVTGSIGDNVIIQLTEDNKNVTVNEVASIYTNRTENEDEHTFEFKSGLNALFNNDRTGNYILSQATQYKVEVDYIGLPYLTAGDTISIETPYGYKNVFLEKATLKFDGGLSGSLTGVGN